MAGVLSEVDRLKNNVGESLRRQAGEALELWSEARRDPDLLEAVQQILGSVRDAARSLGLEDVERAAGAALAAAGEDDGDRRLLALVTQCQRLGSAAELLRSRLVVVVPPDEAANVRGQGREATAAVVPSLEQALQLLRTQGASAVLLPVSRMLAWRTASAEAGVEVPVLAYGDGSRLQERVQAHRLGAAAFLPAPVDLRDAATRVRGLRPVEVTRQSAPILGVTTGFDDGHALETFVGQNGDLRLELARPTEELLDTIDRVQPDVIVVAHPLEGIDALDILGVLAAHHRLHVIPRVLLVPDAAAEAAALLTIADAVLRRDLGPAGGRARLRAVVDRARRERALRDVDPLTGTLSRAALIRAVDREVGLAARSRQPVAVARLEIERLGWAAEGHGPGVAATADRLLAGAVRRSLRETDLVGRIQSGSFALILPRCRAADAAARLDTVRSAWAAATYADPRLSPLTLAGGVVETVDLADDLLLGAERALAAARAKGGGATVIG